MIKNFQLEKFLNNFLEVQDFSNDIGYNGLQVEGKEKINKIVGAVTISVELIKKAIEKKADAIIVHHGLFWKDVSPLIKRWMKKRVKLLVENEINLFAYHIPLDYHEKVGNNVQILKSLGIKPKGDFGIWKGMKVGKWGSLSKPVSLETIVSRVKEKISQNLLVFDFGENKIKTVAVVSGGGSSCLPEAVEKGFDLFITGEPTEWTESYAKDNEINVIFAGHYNTEKFGVIALGNYLAKKFKIKFEFVEIPERI